ncbi:MAG: hypothetical protein KJO91_08310 [Gammaproteobacteria bacterium]|nr:hypothetical protein [Gammaproteobacteria bacterium]
MDNLAEELLNQSADAAAEPQPEVETPEPDAVETKPEETETGAKAEEPQAVEPPSTDEPESVPMSAHIGLRKDFEGKIKALQEQLESKQKEAPPSVFEDEEGAFKAVEAKLSEQFTNQMLNEGEAEAIRQHGQDAVNEATEWITKAVATSPYIAQQFTNVPLLQQHRKAVELHKQEQARAEMDDPDTLKAKLKDEARAELLKEMEAEKAEKDKLKQSIPKSLTGDSSKGGLTGSDWSGPVDLESIIGSGG